MAQSLKSALGYALALILGCLISMAVSFGMVRFLTRTPNDAALSDAQALNEAKQLRSMSNDMVRLMSDYLDRALGERQQPSREFQTWLVQDFEPRLTELRRRFLASRVSSEAIATMLKAGDLMALMRARPGDLEVRREAIQAVREARAAAEGRVAELGLAQSLNEPPVPPVFRVAE